jgi:hypothetical protein
MQIFWRHGAKRDSCMDENFNGVAVRRSITDNQAQHCRHPTFSVYAEPILGFVPLVTQPNPSCHRF